MNKMTITSILLIIVIAIAAFSFSNQKSVVVTEKTIIGDSTDTLKQLIDLNFINFDLDKVEKSLFFNIRGRYIGTTTKSSLSESKLIKDFVPGYPTDWVSDYVSIEMIINKNGGQYIMHSANDTLTHEQSELINSLEINDSVLIRVAYKYKNAATNDTEYRNMKDISLVVVPEFSAMPVFGYDILIQSLEENSFGEIPASLQNEMDQLIIHFSVNKLGEINNAFIKQSSGFIEVDELILDLTNSLRNWTPAKDSKGKVVLQDFILTFGNIQFGC
jgi:hypothetical protein